jgi:iron complex outermembrane receptor protein
VLTLVPVLLALQPPARAPLLQEPQPGSGTDLTELSIEDLLDIEVSIASRTDGRASDAPAAVYVIPGDELRRAGFPTVQEALRMVPGFSVARFDSQSWSVTARGFSGGFANNLQVMIDGVSVFTPLFAGVFWEVQDVDIDDVERIEIIRGPGATLWGSNAVNGIVNVVTKNAADTVGGRISLRGGTEEQIVALRYGAPFAETDGAWRAWFRGATHRSLVDSLGDEADEDWASIKGGFRADWRAPGGDVFKVLGNAYNVGTNDSYFVAFPTPPYYVIVSDRTPFNGGYLLGSWERPEPDGTSTKLQVWSQLEAYKEVDFFVTIDSYDVDFQRTLHPKQDHTLIWGLGYRLVRSHVRGDFTLTSDPELRTSDVFRGYVQDRIDFPSRDLELTVGTQVELNEFTEFEVQPNLRALWRASEEHSFWASIARAVRTPSLAELDVTYNIPIAPATFIALLGNHDLVAEDLLSYELGWRWHPTLDTAVDATVFFNDYDELQTYELQAPTVDGFGNLYFPFLPDNKASAHAYGAELAFDWQPRADWKLRSAWTHFHLESEIDSDSNDTGFSATDKSVPLNQVNVRSYYDLGEGWELDAGLYFVEEVEFFDNPAYLRGDVRLGYHPNEHVELALGLQNAFEDQHPEAGEDFVDEGTEVERAVYASLVWRP